MSAPAKVALAGILAGSGYACGYLEPVAAAMVFIFILFCTGSGGNDEASKLVGQKAPDFIVTDPLSGRSGSLLKDYVALSRPMVIDFYQSF